VHDTPAVSPGAAPGSPPPEGVVVEVSLDLAGLAVPPHSASLLPGEARGVVCGVLGGQQCS
jgi:hypothetical protein